MTHAVEQPGGGPRDQRILFCVGSYFRGGVSSWAIRFVRAARRVRADVRLVLPSPDARARNHRSFTVLEQATDLDDPAVCIRLPISIHDRFATRRERQRSLARALAPHARGATVVLNNDWDLFGAVARLARAEVPMRVIGVVHSDDPLSYAVPEYYAPLFAGMVAVSSTIATELHRRGVTSGLPRPMPVAVIPCGVDLPPPKSSREARSATLRLVTACRLEERQKRVLDIPLIAAALRDAGVPFKWTVVGDGPDRRALEERLDALELGGCVRLLGWLAHDDVITTFRHSDVYVQTSAFEGTPVAVMEAMACGAVPVVSQVSGTQELLGSDAGDQAGIAVRCGDIEAFRRALGTLHGTPGLLTDLGRRSARRARTVLSTESTASAMLEFLGTVPDRLPEWPQDRQPAIPLERIGGREARLDRLPNSVAVAVRRALRR